MNFNYKKNKLEQLKGFCAVVEACCSITKAADDIHISSTTISKQISSLEQDLGFVLFDRIKNKLVLNEKGKAYYKEAKSILLHLDALYEGSIGIREVGLFEIKIKHLQIKFRGYKLSALKFFQKMLIKVTIARFLGFIGVLALGIFIYLYQTNWFFDQKLKRMANPLLKEVMEKGHYRIDKSIVCPFDVVRFQLDVENLAIRISHSKNVDVSMLAIKECPSTFLRMNGNEKDDSAFHNKKEIPCDTDGRYEAYKQNSDNFRNHLLKQDNFHFYAIYSNKKCLNNDIFEENAKKYPIHLIKKSDTNLQVSDGRYWIIRHGKYFYLLLETNANQAHYVNKSQERYLIFKKLTLPELMHYDNGSYWKLIKEYNIKID